MPHLPASLNIVLHCCVANLFRFIRALVLSRVLGTQAAELKDEKKKKKKAPLVSPHPSHGIGEIRWPGGTYF